MKLSDTPIDFLYSAELFINVILVGIAIERTFPIWAEISPKCAGWGHK
jgi:hypothetical protein